MTALLRTLLFGLVAGLMLSSCETTDSPEVAARNAVIAGEARGDYFVGRRYFIDSTRFWGYLREPGKPWSTARLVVMNESRLKLPDRLPEDAADPNRAHGYDNNFEYRITGHYTGRAVYDPNSNLMLPEFMLEGIQLANESPGFLFSPRQAYKADEVTLFPGRGVTEMR